MKTLPHGCFRCGQPARASRYSSCGSSLCADCAQEVAEESREIAEQCEEDAEVLREDRAPLFLTRESGNLRTSEHGKTR
jgi:hypothetical protein